MNEDITHLAFFGDADREFCLTAPMIAELETKAGAGIGVIFTRLTARAFGIRDINETIRLALIGGGTEPGEAARLVGTYAVGRPIAETLPLAIQIFETAFFGAPKPAPEVISEGTTDE